MRSNRFFSLFLLLLTTCFFMPFALFAPSCFALQTIAIANNQTKNITVAANELSRIFVKDDRIQHVRGLDGAYLLTQDATLGQIFIKPAEAYRDKPFNLFITTEKGRNFNLIVKAEDSAGQDIELQPSSPSPEAANWEQTAEYSQVLGTLITSMINGETPPGYSVVYPVKKNKAIKYSNKHASVNLLLQKKYLGKHLFGEVLLVQNKGKTQLKLTESTFYQPGVRAITLLNPVISTHGQTMLFRVMSND